eukprot:GSMAST32.ASY1.ANO1.225.1 assembled CDS
METAFNCQFGLPLSAYPSTKVTGYTRPIPFFNNKCILLMLSRLLINSGGLNGEGIFRLAPDKNERNKSIEQINRGTFRGGDGDVNLYANLIKVWFRDLPNGILNAIDEKTIEMVADEGGIKKAGQFVISLPEPNKTIFLWLLDLMEKVVLNNHVNRMKPRALAIVIAPNLYKPADGANPIIMMQFSGKVVRCLIECLEWRMTTK